MYSYNVDFLGYLYNYALLLSLQAHIKIMRDDYAKLKEDMAKLVQHLIPVGEIDSDDSYENWFLLYITLLYLVIAEY